jgi:GT2 family glycosyltransferase
MTDTLTIIIPTYNHIDLLRDCLASLREQTYSDCEIVVVDDGSRENITAFVEAEFPDTRVLKLSSNMGFASAVNVGLREVRTPYVMLLNNDMTLEPDCIEKMMDAVGEDGADMAAPLVLFKDDPEVVCSAGDRMCKNGRPEAIGFREPLDGFEPSQEVFGVSAGAAIYKKEVFDTVGLFEERFVAYFEDADLAFRARLAGFSAVCVPEARAYHVGSASQEGKTWWRSRQCYRNHVFLVIRCMPWGLLFKYGLKFVREHFHQSNMAFTSARAEFGLVRAVAEHIMVDFSIVWHKPYMLMTRFGIQRKKKITNAELDRMLSD